MKNNFKNNIVVKQDGYTLKNENGVVKHYTKKMSGFKNGYEFVSYSSTTYIDYNGDFDLNFDSQRWNDSSIDINEDNNLIEGHINSNKQISYNRKKIK